MCWIMEKKGQLPTFHASRAQLEKEGLALIFGVKKFHHYHYGRHLTIESDHCPLSYLFNQAKWMSPTTSSRNQRWALTLSAYHCSIRYKAGSTLNNADALSWLPRPITTTSDCLPEDLIHLVHHLSSASVDAGNIKEWCGASVNVGNIKEWTLFSL